MEIEELAVPKRKAEEEFQALKVLLKESKRAKVDDIYSDYQKLYGHLRHGKKVIDVYEAFKKSGLNEDGDPKLAICRADGQKCYAVLRTDGSIIYSLESLGWQFRYIDYPGRKTKNDVTLPANTFEPQDKTKFIETIVPVIPAKILVNEIKVLLKNFHIIWEVEKWKPIPPRDPILVKRLTPNLFGVLATWNLTKLERAVIRGRIY